MKRDWNTIHCILTKVEGLGHRETLYYEQVAHPVKFYHARLLVRDGYVVAVDSSPDDIELDDLTMKGHDELKRLRHSGGVAI